MSVLFINSCPLPQRLTNSHLLLQHIQTKKHVNPNLSFIKKDKHKSLKCHNFKTQSFKPAKQEHKVRQQLPYLKNKN